MNANNDELIKRKNEFMSRFLNQELMVKKENLYSILARTKREAKNNRPFCRYTKGKDNQGEFVITRFRQKIYRDNWKFIH